MTIAVRNPKRGKAHRPSVVRPEVTRCALLIDHWSVDHPMTERVDIADVDPADRCRRCWRGTPWDPNFSRIGNEKCCCHGPSDHCRNDHDGKHVHHCLPSGLDLGDHCPDEGCPGECWKPKSSNTPTKETA
ncbi:MAG: hypothetical protein CMH83_19535 [Nocardioides sp.]|nr:hypothetical protein [Nocardioides sp.]